MPTPPAVDPQEVRHTLREVLDLAMRSGQLMLESGANTARVEDTLLRLGRGLGAERIDAYVTPTGIVATVAAGDEHRTRVLRVAGHAIHLSRVAEVSALVEEVASGALRDRARVRARLDAIAAGPRAWPALATLCAAAAACACFCRLLGGEPRDAAIAAAGALAGQALREHLHVGPRARLVPPLLVAALATAVSAGLVSLTTVHRPGLAVVASVLLLVPGVLMVSSVSDLFRGDMVSGLARAAHATLVVGTAGAGMWLVLSVTGARLTLEPGPPPALPVGFVLAGLAALGFALLFQAPRRALPVVAVVAGGAWLARGLLLQAGASPAPALFGAGLTLGLLAEALTRWRGLPVSLATIPGFVPLVPGLAAFSASLAFGAGDYVTGAAGVVRTLLLVGALAAGLGCATVVARQLGGPGERP